MLNGLFGNYTTNQYPQLQTKVSTTTNPGNIYSVVGINNDGDSVGSAGIYASTFTSFGSGLVAGIYGGLGGNKLAGDGGNTDIGRIGNTTADKAFYSDATLTILSNKNNPIVEVRFADLFPVSLSGLDYNQNVTDVEYLTATIDFRYKLYEIVPIT